MQGFPASLGRVFTLIAGHFPKWNQLLFELVAAIVLAPIVLWVYRRYEPRLLGLATSFYKLSDRPLACLLVVGLLPILLRLALLPWYPVPVPRVADEFGHLLVADTLLQGRLANPEHPLRQHLATMYVLQSPTYASIYPIGQGALLALGRILTGVPWAGVCLQVAMMSSAMYWMLLAWTKREWALAGGLLGAVAFGVTAESMNTYYGGVLAAAGGALVYGALPRLAKSPSRITGLLLGLGGAMTFLVRPYESVLLGAIAGIMLAISYWRARTAGDGARFLGAVACSIPPILAVLGLTLWHDVRVTGNPLLLPYQHAQQELGVPQGMIFQKLIPEPHLDFPGLKWMYDKQLELRLRAGTPRGFVEHSAGATLSLFSYLVGVHFLLVLPGFVLAARRRPFWLPAGICLATFLWTLPYPYFYARYFVPQLGMFMLLVVLGLQAMRDYTVFGRQVGRVAITSVVLATALLIVRGPTSRLLGIEGSFVTAKTRRSEVSQKLLGISGRHLVLIRDSNPEFPIDGWVWNDADVDQSRIVWAHSIDPVSDLRAIDYWRGRSVWTVFADEHPPRLLKILDSDHQTVSRLE